MVKSRIQLEGSCCVFVDMIHSSLMARRNTSNFQRNVHAMEAMVDLYPYKHTTRVIDAMREPAPHKDDADDALVAAACADWRSLSPGPAEVGPAPGSGHRQHDHAGAPGAHLVRRYCDRVASQAE